MSDKTLSASLQVFTVSEPVAVYFGFAWKPYVGIRSRPFPSAAWNFQHFYTSRRPFPSVHVHEIR